MGKVIPLRVRRPAPSPVTPEREAEHDELRVWIRDTAAEVGCEPDALARRAKVPVALVVDFLRGGKPPLMEHIGRIADFARRTLADALRAAPLPGGHERVGIVTSFHEDVDDYWDAAERARDYILAPDHCVSCYAMRVTTLHATRMGIMVGDLVVIDPLSDTKPMQLVAVRSRGQLAVLHVQQDGSWRAHGEEEWEADDAAEELGIVRLVQRELVR